MSPFMAKKKVLNYGSKVSPTRSNLRKIAWVAIALRKPFLRLGNLYSHPQDSSLSAESRRCAAK